MISYLAFDIIITILAFYLMNNKKSLTFYHPGTLLLFFHVVTNTFRFLAVMNGANVLSPDMNGASDAELKRALFWADMGLLFSAGAIYLAEDKPLGKIKDAVFPVNEKLLKGIILVVMPLGLYGMATQLYLPNVKGNVQDYGEWGTSSYVQLIQPWFGLALLALVYFKGFKRQYYIPLFIYLFLIAIQGYQRNRLVLPCIFLLTTYLYYHRLKWPTRGQFIMLICLSILFYPLKTISQIIQEGGSLTDISTIVTKTAASMLNGEADDQVVLDQYAVTLTEIDKKGKIYYGTTLAPLLVSPVPRQIWPGKPKLNEWQREISSYYRPFDVIGSIATLYGESYANFRYLGLLFIPAFLFYGLTRWYRRMYTKPIYDINKFFYTLIFCCMIQVMRDGLISLFIFPVLSNMPLFIIYVSHKLFAKPKKPNVANIEEMAPVQEQIIA